MLILSGSGSSTETGLASSLGLIHAIVHGSRGWASEIMAMWVTVLGPVLQGDQAQDPEFPRVPKLITSPATLAGFFIHGLELGLRRFSILGHN